MSESLLKEYVEMGNNWILVQFATFQDRLLVFDKGPYFINGLNFVLKLWVVFFDPYSSSIDRVDQWVRIPRFPWEFWELGALVELLHEGRVITRIDQKTLFHLKGKFTRVRVNVDITRPLSSSVTIARHGFCTRVPHIYEGLYEVCRFVGGGDRTSLGLAPISLKLRFLWSVLMLKVFP